MNNRKRSYWTIMAKNVIFVSDIKILSYGHMNAKKRLDNKFCPWLEMFSPDRLEGLLKLKKNNNEASFQDCFQFFEIIILFTIDFLQNILIGSCEIHIAFDG